MISLPGAPFNLACLLRSSKKLDSSLITEKEFQLAKSLYPNKCKYYFKVTINNEAYRRINMTRLELQEMLYTDYEFIDIDPRYDNA